MASLLLNNTSIDWLKTGVIALGFAGAYSIIVVILRVPQLSWFIANTIVFKSALIAHVNLSVLVWLLSIACIVWGHNAKHISLIKICNFTALIATIMIAISPFCADNSSAIMNNYIPMLENIVFVIGLSLFGSAVLIVAVNSLYENISVILCGGAINNMQSLISCAALSAALIFIAVWCCFVQSYLELQKIINIIPINIEFYYELLYWSGGHLLQFLFCQILIVVWIILSSELSLIQATVLKCHIYLLILNCIIALCGLMGHHFYDITSFEFKSYYTDHMRYTGGIAPLLSLILIMYDTLTYKVQNYCHIAKTTIICSTILFLFGGFIGILIFGTNVIIPAHYHGSIVAITIAFMGFAYSLCNIKNIDWCKYQLYTITLGQILHVLGLAIAGGYGVLRKTPAAELKLSAAIAMGLVGIGGIIAIVGGLMFVFICGKSLFRNSKVIT